MKDDELKSALIKKALGGEANEVVEEYGTDKNGKIVLTKRKVTTKTNLPDVSALKMLLDEEESVDFEQMTDSELQAEKARLLNLLKEKENENGKA